MSPNTEPRESPWSNPEWEQKLLGHLRVTDEEVSRGIEKVEVVARVGYLPRVTLHWVLPLDGPGDVPETYEILKTRSLKPPHQRRVIQERDELQARAKSLSDFIGLNPTFLALDPPEQERMRVQNDLMWQLFEVLEARIANFKP